MLEYAEETYDKVTRAIFFYARHECVPEFLPQRPRSGEEKSMVIDAVFMYGNLESEEEMSQLEAVYKGLLNLTGSSGMTLMVTGSYEALIEHAIMLLAHVRQRSLTTTKKDLNIKKELLNS